MSGSSGMRTSAAARSFACARVLEQPARLLGVRPARILAEVAREVLLRSRELADLEEEPPELEPSRRILPGPIESLLRLERLRARVGRSPASLQSLTPH